MITIHDLKNMNNNKKVINVTMVYKGAQHDLRYLYRLVSLSHFYDKIYIEQIR